MTVSRAVDRVTARALALKPGVVFLAVLWAPFAALGWLLYWLLWTPFAYFLSCGIDGWEQAKAQRARLMVEARERENR